MSTIRLTINPDILDWSLKRAGLSPEDIKQKFPDYVEWSLNKKKPTLHQLEQFSKKVHLPFGYFFLTMIPHETVPIPDFRTFNTKVAKIGNLISVELRDTIHSMQYRQDWLRSYCIENEFPRNPFNGCAIGETNIEKIVNQLKNILQLSDWSNVRFQDQFNYLRDKIEENNIFVFSNSIVDNNIHRKLDIEEFRGFVLADDYAPLIFINSNDSKNAQLFTLVHELAHVA
ncbi:MAG: ImmA/IrrE family metallo-endopeptidase, partial [Gammaproteobacteria bacterium]|nr:ImmA/IrrE family metallo-endopeptidase [Gammaproteobacteria bacterium]